MSEPAPDLAKKTGRRGVDVQHSLIGEGGISGEGIVKREFRPLIFSREQQPS